MVPKADAVTTAERNWIDVPELVAFNVTSKCNLRCRYCFEGNLNRDNDATFDEAVDVLDQLDDLGVPEVLLEGGEIFACDFAERLLRLLPKYRFEPHVITNGTLINRNWARLFKEQNMSIGISLDGPTPEYMKHRGNVFSVVVEGIETMVAAGVTTYVNCTVTQQNAAAISALAEFCESLGVFGLVLQQLHCSGKADREFFTNNVVSLEDQEGLLTLLPELVLKHPNLYFVESEVLDLANVPGRYHSNCRPGVKYKPKELFRCAAGRRFCVIQADLTVIPCGILPTFTCGDLRKNTLEEVWRDSDELRFIRELSKRRVREIPGCEECRFAAVCDGGCRGDTFNLLDDWLGAHPTCVFQR
jgi:Fe-coproporphyrin III synthase